MTHIINFGKDAFWCEPSKKELATAFELIKAKIKPYEFLCHVAKEVPDIREITRCRVQQLIRTRINNCLTVEGYLYDQEHKSPPTESVYAYRLQICDEFIKEFNR